MSISLDPTSTGLTGLPTPLSVANGGTGTSVLPAFSAYQSTLASITSTPTKIVFQTETFDTAASHNTATGVFAPTVSGYYQIHANISFASTAYVVQAFIYKGGVVYKYGSAAAAYTSSVTDLVYLDGTGVGANGYVEIYCYSATSQNSTTGANYTYVSGILIAKA